MRNTMVKIVKEPQCMILQGEEDSIAYQGKMMRAIPWLLPFEWVSGKELVYRKGDGQNLLQWLQGEKREEEILEVLETFFHNEKELESYLIDEEKLILDPEWIFWVEKEKKLQLAYVPWDVFFGTHKSFVERVTKLLWCAAVDQKWQNERLILMLYRMQSAVRHQNQPKQWIQWIEQEKRRIKERKPIKEQSLDILTEKESDEVEKSWFHRLKERFPFAIR